MSIIMPVKKDIFCAKLSTYIINDIELVALCHNVDFALQQTHVVCRLYVISQIFIKQFFHDI